MSRYQVRPASLKDAKAVSDIHMAASQAAFKGLVPDEALSSLSAEKSLAHWREAISFGEPQLLVATDADKVVGFAGFDRSRDKGTPPTTGEVWSLSVAPSHWSTGAGLALWDAARDGLQEEGCTKVTVWVPLRNDRALQFFEHAGFKREMPSAKTIEMGGVKIEEVRLQRKIA